MKKNIYLMYAISLFQGMVFYGAVATLYRESVGVNILQITIIESISLALCLLLEVPWGKIADKIGYKNSMIICSLLFAISKIIFWKATGFYGFLFERIIIAIVFAGLSGVDSSILFLSTEKENSQKTFGLYYYFSSLGLLLSAIIFSIFIRDNYRLASFLTVITYSIAFILSLCLKKVTDTADMHECTNVNLKSIVTKTLKNKGFLCFLIAIALFNETHQMITVFLSQLKYANIGVSNLLIGLSYTLIAIVSLSTVFSSSITSKLGH